MIGIDAVWIAFGSGLLVGFALAAIVLWIVPAWRDSRAAEQRTDRGNAEVIDLATARLQRNLREDLRARRAVRR